MRVPPEVKKRWPIAVLTCICLGLLLLVEAEFSVTEPFVTSNCEVSCWIGTSLKQSPCALSEGIGCHTSTDLMNWKFLNETMHDTSIVSSVGTPPWWIERSDDQHGNDTEPIEVPLTRPTTITSVGWVAHEITNLCTTPPDGGDYDASRCDAPVGTFAATISDVPVATCLVVVRVVAGPTVVPTADAPSTGRHAASASPSPPRAYGGWFERDRYGSHTAVGCCEDRPWTRPSSVTAADTVWDPLILPDLTHAIDAPCLPRLPQPPRSILRSLPARQRRLMRAAVRRRSMLRAQRATLEGTTDNVLVPHARASPLVLGGGCTQNTSVAVNPVRPPPSTTTLATTSVPPAPDTPALLSFWVCDPSGKHRHCTVDSETVVGDFFAQSTWFDPDVCWISQGTRQLVLSDSFAENAVNRDDTLTVMVRLLGGGGRGSWRGGKGNRGGRGAGSSGTSVPSAPAGDASSGTKGHKGGKSRRGNGPPDGLVWSDGARDCDKADLYRDWEFPEMRFRAVFPLHVFDGDVTHASWEEVSGSPFQWGQYYLHSVLTRGAVNSCWDAAAKQEFSRGEVYQTLEIHFSANAADEVDILRASGYQGAYFEPLNSQDYRVLLVPDRADMGEVSSIAAKIDHLQLGLSYCRGELGVRVRASSYAEARQLLPDLPAEIAYFAVAGIPCGSNANTLQRNLTRLGWNVTPLFKTAKSGRYAEWAVKSETLPGRFDCDLLNGMRITIKRVDRYPIQPSRHIASVRLSSSYRDESNTLRCDVHEGSTPVPYSVFLERYGKAASTLWELAGKSSTTDGADGSSFGNDGTPLAGGSEVGLTSYAKATLRPCSSPPPARANPTSSSSPSSSPVNPPRAVADIDELELQSLVRSLVKEATSSTASAPVPRVAPLPEQPPTQDAAAFKEFVGSIVRESVADMEKKRAPTLGACEVATLVENSVGACVAQKVSEAVAGPLLEVTAQLKLMGERMTTLAARVDETLVAAPPAEASLGLVPYSQNLVSTELAQPLVNRPQKLDAMKVAMPVLDGDSVKENVKIITALHKKMKSTRPRSRSLTLSQDSTASQHSAANQALLADGLVKGLAEITRGIQSLQPDVLLLQETWLSDISLPPHLDGYIAFRLDRGGIGGGLLTFVKSNLSATVIPGASVSNDPHTECLGVEIKRVGLPPLKVLNVYRPPGAHTRKTLNLDSLELDDTTIIAGDLNLHHPQWSKGAPNPGGTALFHWAQEYPAVVHNVPSKPTREPSRARPSSPDIVITARSPVPLIHGWDTLPPWGSDHKVLIFRAARGHRQVLPKRPPHYVWAKADWEEFQKEVEQRSPTSPDLGIQERSDRLSAAIRSAIREHVPRASGKRPHQPWWTQELSLLEKQKRLALTASEGDPFDADKLEAYGQAKESFTAAAHLAKGTYWRKVVAGINFGTSLSFLFGIIRSIDGRSQRCSLPPLLDGQSQRTTSREKADLLGKCLAETCKAKEEGAPSRFQPTYGPEPEPDDGIRGATGEITPEELDRAIEDLQKKESLDPQGLCSTALKNLGPEARKSMLLLFNESWKQGTIPSQWKDAYVVPVHKPGKDRSSPQGYRPIALTCVSAKLMEMVVKNRLVHITESPDFPTVMPYTNIQGGFREDRGTEEQVFSIIASLDEARSQGEFACFLSFDLVSAFDTVDHDRLLRILERRGIPQRFVLWLRAFLEDRTARFKVDGVLGKSFGLQSGVPQGTVLGPVLFLLCIDDLGGEILAFKDKNTASKVTPSLYADDAGFVVSAKRRDVLTDRAQGIVDLVENWAIRAKMRISHDKTKGIFFNWKRGDNSAAPLLVFNSTREEIQPDPHDASWGFNNCRFVSHGDMRVHHGKHVVAHNGIPVRSGDDLRPRNETTSIEVATTLNWVTRHRFLGLIIDDELSFRPHVNYVLDRLSQRMIILRRTCMKSWDLSVSTNRKVYLTYVLPVITHCLAAYGPFLLPRPGCPKPGLLAVLESRHRAALSYVLGCRKGVSAFIVQREARVLSIHGYIEYRLGALCEKMSLRRSIWSDVLDTRSLLLKKYADLNERARTKTRSREIPMYCPFRPWESITGVTINSTLGKKRSKDPATNLRTVSTRLDALPKPYRIAWADGSARREARLPRYTGPAELKPWSTNTTDTTLWGGGGVYVQNPFGNQGPDWRRPVHGNAITWICPVGAHANSYRAEQVSLLNAVEILDEETAQEAATQAGTEDPKVAWVLSDSQSLATELSLGAHRQKRRLNQLIWLKFGNIVKRGYTLILQFVFGHCKLAGNDHADSLAKKAAKLAYELSLSPEMVLAVGVSRPPPFSYVEATNRFKLFLFREDGERGAKGAIMRARRLVVGMPFYKIVGGRKIPVPDKLTVRAEKEIRQFRTMHHGLFVTRYFSGYMNLPAGERALYFRPCPLCGYRVPSFLPHIFISCRHAETGPARAAMWDAVGFDRSAAIEIRLWELLFKHPDVALRYLQRINVIPQYAIQRKDAEGTRSPSMESRERDEEPSPRLSAFTAATPVSPPPTPPSSPSTGPDIAGDGPWTPLPSQWRPRESDSESG
ncbi:putative RNA-directed DNA polymerase from transposon X-element [Diplonema papillatum]|nr:putative RNA-directed DNA polymerase from transposon X-element [Diplonema papillatum]